MELRRGKSVAKRFIGALPAGTQLAQYAENRARIEFWPNGVSDTHHVTVDPGGTATLLNYLATTSGTFPMMFDREIHGDIVTFAWYGGVGAGLQITVVETYYENYNSES